MYPESKELTLESQLTSPTYQVVMHNDDYTTMEFVVLILHSIFHHDLNESTRLMELVHKKGNAVVGVYAYDIAATKVEQVHQLAQQSEYPLRCTVELRNES